MGFKIIESILYLSVLVVFRSQMTYGLSGNLGALDLNCERPSVTTASGSLIDRSLFCPGELIFEDNFDILDLDKWQHEHTLGGGGNGEFQYYLNNRENSFVEDGVFYIKPTLLGIEPGGEEFLSSGTLDIHGGDPGNFCTNPAWEGCVRTGSPDAILNPVKSARVRTVNSFNFKYGHLEISAKLPTGDWMWPALWLMPRINQYGTWPASGEIDLMEARCNVDYHDENGTHLGVEQVLSTLHFGPNAWTNAYNTSTVSKNSPPSQGFNKNFHRYQLEWTPDYMAFHVDDEFLFRVDGHFWERGNFDERAPGTRNPWITGTKMAPFDQEFFIIMNLAIGGTNGYFPDDNVINSAPKPWSNQSPVRVAMTNFWKQKDNWISSWNLEQNDGKESAFQIDYVRVWAL
ncbi:beta-1,3-glucan-binding protein-like [Malaya genurostris]|uniref:beta-1,3-glucan-binding protein-like n=1 Tax=Malaya genurostris TaxID=325434 RepID=UPI0026F3EA87|nr:beta-1,3-glucan-binding protein-like [Malaya genurostris]